MSKKDVLFLCQYFYPEYVSSATLPYDTAVALSEKGYKVGALTGYPYEYNLSERVPVKEVKNNIQINRMKYLHFKRKSFFGRLVNYLSFIISVLLHFKTLSNYKSVVVYSNPPILPIVASLANRVFGTKIVFVSYDVYPEMAYITNSISRNGLISKAMQLVNKIVFKRVDKVVALSTEMKNYLLRNRRDLIEEQINVIPNWHKDVLPEEKNELSKNHPLNDLQQHKGIIVSYFGNMGVCQNLDTIIETIRMLKNDKEILFFFAGHGHKMQELQEIVDNENIENVLIMDFLHGNDFDKAMKLSDVCLLSLADGLSGLAVPSKTYSYMVSGKPVIAIIGSDTDISEDLENYNAGYSFEVGESSKVVQAINELKSNESKRIQIGQNSRKVFEDKYTEKRSTDKYIDVIHELLRK